MSNLLTEFVEHFFRPLYETVLCRALRDEANDRAFILAKIQKALVLTFLTRHQVCKMTLHVLYLADKVRTSSSSKTHGWWKVGMGFDQGISIVRTKNNSGFLEQINRLI